MISYIAVLIPARDEAQRIRECLHAVAAAADRCPIDASITVVADNCTDDTARIARDFPQVTVIEISAGNVGVARATAASHALSASRVPPTSVWLANTDADSVVPDNWLTSQVDIADRGYDIVIGTVRPDPREYPPDAQHEWEKTHIAGRPNGHIHGANLGVRASVYLDVDGFRALPEHEDVDLIERLVRFRSIASDDAEVITCARLAGRTPGGYAGYLRDLLRQSTP